jgi:large subunit ribosomal protein L4
MPEVTVYNMEGQELEPMALRDEIFGLKANVPLMHQVVVAQAKAARNPTASTKTRSEVAGSTAKIWRQKGTGRARHGSRKPNVFVGGGVSHGPRYRDLGAKVPKKMRRQAVRQALSAKVAAGHLHILDGLKLDAYSTRSVIAMLEALGIEGSVLLILAERDEKVERSCRNVVGLEVCIAPAFATRDVLAHDRVLVTTDAVRKLEGAWLS